MDCSLTPDQKARYDVWMHSPSVFTSYPTETILAFKISIELVCSPSEVLKALRKKPVRDERVPPLVEDFVANDPSLAFDDTGSARRIILVE
jgi:hypothetical protein